MPTLSSPVAAALNHLLESQPWARDRLVPFAGRTVRFFATPLPALDLRIGPDGLLARPEDMPAPDVTVRIAPAALLGWTQPRGEGPPLGITLEGDAELRDAVLELSRHLRWDGEEALSRLIGDPAAHRVGSAVRSLAAWQADAVRRLGDAAGAWIVEEKNLLATRAEFDEFRSSVQALREALERLEKRLP